MANFYVSLSGSNTAPYDTLEKAANKASTVLTYIKDNSLTSPHTIRIIGGTYDDDLNINSTSYLSNIEIIGDGYSSTEIDTSSAYLVRCYGVSNVTITGIHFKETGNNPCVYIDATSSSITISECILEQNYDSATQNAITVYGTDIIIEKSIIKHNGDASVYVVNVSSEANDVNFRSCIFSPTDDAQWTGMFNQSVGETTIANCVFAGSKYKTIGVFGGTLNLYNSFVGSSFASTSSYTIYIDGGTCNAYNSIIYAPPHYGNDHFVYGSLNIDSNNIYTNPDPKFVSVRGGFIIPCVDDNSNLSYAKDVEDVLASYNMKGTFATYLKGYDSSFAAEASAMVKRGTMEVAAHSYSHSILTHTNVLSFSYSGSDTNPQVSMDSNRIIHLTTTEGNDDITIDTTNASYDTVGEIISAYNGTNNWSISKAETSGIEDAVKATSFSEMTATTAPCDLPYDRSGYNSGFFNDEITSVRSDIKAWVNPSNSVTDPQTGSSYTPNTFVCPGNYEDTAVASAIKDAGYLIGRGNLPGPPNILPLTHYHMFALKVLDASNMLKASSDSDVRIKARALGNVVSIAGLAAGVLSHNSSELTATQWNICCYEWSNIASLTVTSAQIVSDAIKNSGSWSTNDDVYYDKSLSVNDYKLRSDSPCINMGYPIRSMSSDIDGNIRPSGGQIDIGAYEYQQNLYDGEYVWYVRPSGGSYGYENGKTYANAWDGFSNIVWNQASGMYYGDTLYICGTHNESFAVEMSGLDATPVYIRGDYPPYKGIIDVQNSATRCVYISDKDNIIASGLVVRGGTQEGIYVYTNSSVNNIQVCGASVDDVGQYGLYLYTTNASAAISNIVFENCSVASIGRHGIYWYCNPNSTPEFEASAVKIKSCKVTNFSTADNDYRYGINITYGREILIEDCNIASNFSGRTYASGVGLVYTHNGSVRRNIVHNIDYMGIRDYKNYNASDESTYILNNIVKDVTYGVKCTGRTDGSSLNAFIEGNTIFDTGNSAISAGSGFKGTRVINNIVASSEGYGISFDTTSVSSILVSNNLLFDCANLLNNCTDDKLATADPKFFNTTSMNFKLQETSPCIKSGSSTTEATQDILGRPFVQASPPIGAYDSRIRTHRKDNNFRRWFTP